MERIDISEFDENGKQVTHCGDHRHDGRDDAARAGPLAGLVV
jgi:hypothetical protein